MKQLINKLFGVKVYATSKNVQGNKSQGIADVIKSFKYFKSKEVGGLF